MELWERQKGESNPRWEGFQTYRDLPPGKRSLRAVAEILHKGEPTLKRWSAEDKWGERCEAYDRYLDAEAAKQKILGIAEMNKRHINAAEKILDKAIDGLKHIEPDEMKPSDIAKLVDVASRLERLARGDATEVVETREGESIANAVQFYMPSNGRDDDGNQTAT